MPQDFFYYDPSQKPVAGTPLDLNHFGSTAIGIWPMWEGAGISIEDVVNGNTGTMGRDVSWGVDRTLVFSGITGNIDCGPALNPSLFGISTLIYRNGSQNSFAMIACSAFSVSSGGFQLYHYGITNHLGGFVNYSDGTNSGDIDTGYLIPNQTWTHIAMTLDGRNLTFYANGIQVFQKAALGKTLSPTTNHLRIGCNSADSGNIFFGSMANLILLSGVVTPDQIKELSERPYGMFAHPRVFPLHTRKSTVVRPRGPTWRNVNSIVPNNEKPEAGTPVDIESDLLQNVVSYWPFWEGAGKLTEDVLGNNTGTIAGNPVWAEGLVFDGTTNNVLVKNGAILGNSSVGTISFKVVLSSVTGRSLYAENTNGGVIFSLCMDASNHFVMQIKQSNGIFAQAIGSTTALAGLEYNATTTFSVTNGIRLYINGRLEAIASWDGTIYTVGGVITKSLIGDFVNAGSFKWGGTIRYGVLFNTELTSAQVGNLYSNPYMFFARHRSGSSTSPIAAKTYVSNRRLDVKELTQKPVAGTPLDLDHWASQAVAIWPMWEGGGQQIEDLTGNGHTGTISNLTNGAVFGQEGLVFPSGGGIKLAGIPLLTNWSWVAIINPLSPPGNYGNLINVSSSLGIWIHTSKIDLFNSTDHLANTTLQFGVEQFVAVTCTASGSINFYYNGNPDGSASANPISFPFDGMGADSGLTGEPYKGQMKFVMLFDYVLTPDQVKGLYERPYEMFSQNRRGRSVVMPARLKVSGPRGVSSPGAQQAFGSPMPGTILDQNSDLATGLAGYWPMWEGGGQQIEDVSGNGNNGTINGGVTWSAGSDGTSGSWKFDGQSGSYISLSKVALTTQLTVSCIFKISSTASSQVCAAQTDFTTGNTFVLFASDGTNLKWRIGTPTDHNVTAPLPSVNQWHMAVGTYDGVTSRLYLDGVLVGSTPVTGNLYNSSNVALHIGDYGAASGNSSNLNGSISTTGIWSTALTAEQVATLYNDSYQLFRPKRSRVAAVANLTTLASSNIYSETGSSGVIIAGLGGIFRITQDTGSNGTLVAGTGTNNEISFDTGLSGVLANGAAANLGVIFIEVGANGVLVNGSGSQNQLFYISGSSGVVVAGDNSNMQTITEMSMGGIVIGGSVITKSNTETVVSVIVSQFTNPQGQDDLTQRLSRLNQLNLPASLPPGTISVVVSSQVGLNPQDIQDKLDRLKSLDL